MKKFVTIGLAVLTLASAAASGGAYAQRPLGDKDRDGVPNAVDRHDDRWDPAWGRMVAPPRHWNRSHQWNHHVGLCREKYPTFDPRRDMYRDHKRWVRCSLY
jgi:hypothetical protein